MFGGLFKSRGVGGGGSEDHSTETGGTPPPAQQLQHGHEAAGPPHRVPTGGDDSFQLVEVQTLTGHTVGRCKLDPGLKAPGFQKFSLIEKKLAFRNLNLVSELAPLQHGSGVVRGVGTFRQSSGHV